MPNLKQHGGEGGGAYKGHKSDMNLPQHGGEGGGKEGTIPKGSSSLAFTPGKPNVKYCGPGRYLSIEK